MERLTKIGQIIPKRSDEIRHSRIGLGFEKLDRDVFDPKKAYPFVPQSGVKWARLQSGWQKTEREKGVYNFAWLDDIVDNMIAAGVEPWLCLCYGNDLYTDYASKYFGAVGCAPTRTPEEREGWLNYVKATVEHYKGRIHYYEVWNEPDGQWCWKTGPDAKELGEFTIATAKACKEADPTCEVLGFVLCMHNTDFPDQLAATGCCEYLDGITYHAYDPHEEVIVGVYDRYDEIRKKYNPKLKIIQGESGTQSRSDGMGALRGGAWTPLRQAKYLLRHLIIDLGVGVEFTSYFSCMDMIEALNGLTGQLNSYLDYGYFGVVGADFDENGVASGDYTPKMSFKALQNLTSIFCNEVEPAKLPVEGIVLQSPRLIALDYDFNNARSYGFVKPNGSAGLCYWVPKDILSETYEGTCSLRIPKGKLDEKITLVDLLDGSIYALPESMIATETIERKSDVSSPLTDALLEAASSNTPALNGKKVVVPDNEAEDGDYIKLVNLPIADHPMLLCFGDFCC